MRQGATPLRLSKLQEALEGSRFGSSTTLLGRVGSTSDFLLARARAGAPDGAVVVADAQTQGRGRRGTQWESPARHGLYLSCLLRRLPAMESLRLFAPCAGLAVATTLRNASVPAGIKWPNDVMLGNGKLAGILVDVTTEGARSHAVIGIGLNLTRGVLPTLSDTAIPPAFLSDFGPGPWRREELVVALLRCLETELELLENGALEHLRSNTLQCDVLRGRHVIATMGETIVQGRVLEADPILGVLLRSEAGLEQRLDPARTHLTWVEGFSAAVRP